MSYWTHVRILYDVEVQYPKKNNKIIDSENGLGYLGLTQLYATAKEEMLYKSNTIFNLGSEGPVDIILKVFYGSSNFCGKQSITTDDRGQLIIIGDLRDCMKDEFVEKLNEFREHLKNYGIFVVEGLVNIK